MPAPPKAMISAAIMAAIAVKPSLCQYMGTPIPPPVSGVPAPGMVDLVDAISEGIANFWLVWQLAQPVTGTATAVQPGPGTAPVTGILP